MLKGLKLKSNITTSHNSETNEPISNDNQERENKKWMKGSLVSEKKQEVELSEITEQNILKFSRDIWNLFLQGNCKETERNLHKLKREQEGLVKSIRLKMTTTKINPFTEEDEFMESVEKNAMRNFDPKKSAYLISDIYKDEVKSNQSRRNASDNEVYSLYKRKPMKVDPDNLYDVEYDKEFEKTDDDKPNKKNERKYEMKQQRKNLLNERKLQRTLANCKFCMSNNAILEEQILSYARDAFLMIPELKTYKHGHFYIVPVEHSGSLVELEDEEYEQIRNYMKCLVAMYDQKDYGVTFFENHVKVGNSSHCVIECVATPREINEELPLYFRKALNELESEWNTHKKIIEIKKEKGGIRKQIPKNFPYFYVDFNTAYGFAHVIEKPEDYKTTFAHEIIGPLLNIDRSKILYPEKLVREDFTKMRELFLESWEDHDWTKLIT